MSERTNHEIDPGRTRRALPLEPAGGWVRRACRGVGLALALFGVIGCSPTYVRGTRVPFTEEKQSLADLVERYRIAVEQRDTDALRAMVSEDYYENASTTNDPSDDYDISGLHSVLGDIKNSVKAVKHHVDIRSIEILGEMALVDYDYRSEFLFTMGEQDKWETAADKNRLTFRKVDGKWRIISGL